MGLSELFISSLLLLEMTLIRAERANKTEKLRVSEFNIEIVISAALSKKVTTTKSSLKRQLLKGN